MPPRSSSLLGCKPPFVKGGELVLPVLIDAAEWVHLSAAPSLWAQIRDELDALCPRPAAKRGRPPRLCNPGTAPSVRPGRRPRVQVDPDRYLAASVDYLAGRFATRRACARAYDLPSISAWDYWRARHADEIAAARARAPVPKPKGTLL